MASSSSYGVFLISLALVLQFLLGSSSTAFIDAVCGQETGYVIDKAFCIKTLIGYPPAASATSTIQVTSAVLGLGMSYSDKSADFSAKAAMENPNLKKQFEGCQDAFKNIINNLKSASGELKEDPHTALYDVMLCMDETTRVKNLIGKNSDKDSKNVIMMTSMMLKYINIAVGAVKAAGG